MTTVFVRDELRASVEGATGGQCTVLYTQGGMPSYFFVLPKFNLEDIDASLGQGTHPAFIINGQEVSRIFVGMFLGVVKNLELLSLPQLAPQRSITLENAAQYARNCGGGFHLITNAEWAAIALWCLKNEWLPSGNSNWGQNHLAPFETGVRFDGGAPGAQTGIGATLTGSGPASWRHNNQAGGISDLVGNLREWVAGIRLVEGELQVFQNNDVAACAGAFNTAPDWKAIRYTNGTLVAPGTTGSVKMDMGPGESNADQGGSVTGRDFVWSDTITQRLEEIGNQGDGYFLTKPFKDIISEGPDLLKTLALAPAVEAEKMGNVCGRNYGTRYFSRGETYLCHDAGIFSFAAQDIVGASHYFTGARVAKY